MHSPNGQSVLKKKVEDLIQPQKQKAAKNERRKKQTSCCPIDTVDESITVNNEEEDQQSKIPKQKVITRTKRVLWKPQAKEPIVGVNKDQVMTAPQTPPTLTSLNGKKAKHSSPPNNHLYSGEKLTEKQDQKKVTRNRKKVQRDSREVCSPTDVVTDMSQVTKKHEIPSPLLKGKETVQKRNRTNSPPTLKAVTNEEVYIEEPSSEPTKLPLTTKELETDTFQLPKLEREQSVSVNREDPVAKDTPSLPEGKQVIDETIRSLIYSHPLVIETVPILENFDDENKAYPSPSKLEKIAEKRNDSAKLALSETNSSEKRKDMQESPSDSVTKSTECSLPFSGIISHNDSLMEGFFHVRYLIIITFKLFFKINNLKLLFLEREICHLKV